MPTKYTDGPESPDTSDESTKQYAPNPVAAPNTADTSTSVPNRTEYTDGPEPSQNEV
jgi:hypothetical protein